MTSSLCTPMNGQKRLSTPSADATSAQRAPTNEANWSSDKSESREQKHRKHAKVVIAPRGMPQGSQPSSSVYHLQIHATQLCLDDSTESRSRYPSPSATGSSAPIHQTLREPRTSAPKAHTKLVGQGHPSNLLLAIHCNTMTKVIVIKWSHANYLPFPRTRSTSRSPQLRLN